MATLTMKFGGSSVGTSTALTQVISIVLHEHRQHDKLVLIVSALDGVTDMLLEAAHLAQINNQRGYRRIAANLRTRHLSLVDVLPFGGQERATLLADIDRLLFEMLDTCQSIGSVTRETLPPDLSDTVAAVGERLAARIIAGLLRQNQLRSAAVDGTDIIITDEVHGNATPNLALTRERVLLHLVPMLERDIIPVVTGYIGSTPKGKTTTIGRGGSDYTASILSVCLNANELWIWSDVDGMMSADPREIDSAHVIEELSYNEVAELAYFGARILHSRMVQPLKDRDIPLRVKNVYKPQVSGTRVHRMNQDLPPRIKAVTSIQGIALTAERSGATNDVIALVDQALLSIGVRADVMLAAQSSAQSFLCFVVPTSAGFEAVDTVMTVLRARLAEYRDVTPWTVQPVSIVTAIGDKIDQTPSLMGQIFAPLDGIRLLAIAQGPARCSVSLVVMPADAETTLRRLHKLTVR